MSTRRAAKKRTNWVLRLLLVVGAAFLFLKAVQLHLQMDEKQQQIDALQNQIYTQQVMNEDLEEQKNKAQTGDYLSQKANDAGWVLPGQQIYQSSAG